MTVKELIDLLSTLPQDAHVALTHSWDSNDRQFDVIDADSVTLELAEPNCLDAPTVFHATDVANSPKVVVIR